MSAHHIFDADQLENGAQEHFLEELHQYREHAADDSITIPAVDIQHQDGFAICLVLVKDDTERLAEWLAYNWLALLLLQDLAIAADRTSAKNLKPILDMWREETGDMDITPWNDSDYRHAANPKLNPKQKYCHWQRQITHGQKSFLCRID